MTEESIVLLDNKLVNLDATLNFANISECIGENDKAMTAVYGLVLGSDTNQDMYVQMLKEAFVEYFGTDIEAAEILRNQRNSDWIDSGRRMVA